MLKSSAHQNPLTLNPFTRLLTRSTKSAFITNIKSPKVTTVMGRVNKSKSGFKNTFITPKTTATIRVVTIESTSTPGRIEAAIKTAAV